MINIVLYEPRMPQNTGNIMRTCVAFNMKLHIIEPISFSLDEKRVKRSGMDYILNCDYTLYPSFNDFISKNKGHYSFITRYGNKIPSDIDYNIEEDIYLIFGSEDTGVPKNILREYPNRLIRLPMEKNSRSLNLSNCVAILAYEVLRQRDFNDLSKYEFIKGKDYIFMEDKNEH